LQIDIAGHHFTISDRIKEHVEGEVEKLQRYYTPLVGVHVKVTQEARTLRADVVVNVHGQSLKASEEADRVYTALDGAMDKMGRQLRKLHDKRRKPRPAELSEDPDRTET